MTSRDNAYFVKFYTAQGKNEINPTEEMFDEYQNFVCRSNVPAPNIFFTNAALGTPFLEERSEINFEVDFIKKETVMEEVHTYA